MRLVLRFWLGHVSWPLGVNKKRGILVGVRLRVGVAAAVAADVCVAGAGAGAPPPAPQITNY